jgi:pimeloyl-ACP methyl ester carboxylesterase
MGGCVASRIDSAAQLRTGQTFCLRGLLDVFSLGLNDLSERLRSEGIEAITVSGPSWPSLARKIHRARLRGDLQKPLILVGHSYGADDAIRLARKLGRWNIDVELLVLLDATIPPPLPSNVARCLHVYRPTVVGDLFPFLFAGNPVDAEEGNHRTEIVNKIVSRENFGAAAARMGHLNLDASVAVHDLILKKILRICPPGDVRERSLSTGSEGRFSGILRGGG